MLTTRASAAFWPASKLVRSAAFGLTVPPVVAKPRCHPDGCEAAGGPVVAPGQKQVLRELRSHQDDTVGRSSCRAGCRFVVLVTDVADELLEEILQRDEADRAGAVIAHDRQVLSLAKHAEQ